MLDRAGVVGPAKNLKITPAVAGLNSESPGSTAVRSATVRVPQLGPFISCSAELMKTERPGDKYGEKRRPSRADRSKRPNRPNAKHSIHQGPLARCTLHIPEDGGSGDGTGRRDRETGPGNGSGRRDRETGPGDVTGRRDRETGPGDGAGRRDRETGPGDGIRNRDVTKTRPRRDQDETKTRPRRDQTRLAENGQYKSIDRV